MPYRWVYCGLIVFGAISKVDTVWAWGDLMNGLQIFPNLVGIIGLCGRGRGHAARPDAGERPPARMSGFARARTASCGATASRWRRPRRASARRSTSTARAALTRGLPRLRPTPSRRCRTGSATRSRPTAPARSCASWRGWARAPTSSPAASCRRRCAPASRPSGSCSPGVGKTDAELALGLRSGHRRVQRGERGARSRRLSRAAAAAAAARARGHAAREPRHRPPLPPLHLDRPAREQVRRGHRGGAGDPRARARACPAIEITGVQCHIGSQITRPGPAGARPPRALAALSRRLLAEGFALEHHRHRRRPGRRLRGRRGARTRRTLAARGPARPDAACRLTLLLEPGRSLVARGRRAAHARART